MNFGVRFEKLQKKVGCIQHISVISTFISSHSVSYVQCLTLGLSNVSLLLHPYHTNRTGQLFSLLSEIWLLVVFWKAIRRFDGGSFSGYANAVFGAWGMFKVFMTIDILPKGGWAILWEGTFSRNLTVISTSSTHFFFRCVPEFKLRTT